MKTEFDIYLSYAREDRERILPLVQALEGSGWSVFWEDRSNKLSKSWQQAVEEALQSCRCMVVVWTKRSVASNFVKEEAMLGLQNVMFFLNETKREKQVSHFFWVQVLEYVKGPLFAVSR